MIDPIPAPDAVEALPAAPVTDGTADQHAPWQSQPHTTVLRDGVQYTLLGTAHVSHASVAAVEVAIASGAFDAVAVELDAQRLQALTDPDAMARLDLVKVIKQGKVALFAANLGLAAYQRRLAEQLGIEPGAELLAAVHMAKAQDLPVHLVDRDVGITFRRVSARLGFMGRMKLGVGLVGGLFSSDEVGEAEIESLKEGDMLEASFGEFAKDNPDLFAALIDERDQYMAAGLRELGASVQRHPARSDVHASAPEDSGRPVADDAGAARASMPHVLAVVGAGHLQGLARYVENGQDDPVELRATLDWVRTKKSVPWVSIVITALILGGIAWGYWSGGVTLGRELLLQWVIYTAGFAALGCVLAAGHPLSVLSGALAAPLKPFRPGVPSGAFAALAELRMRKPAYGDFLALRDDVQSVKGVYRNRVARVVLVFMLTNIGTGIGFWLAGVRIIGKLAH